MFVSQPITWLTRFNCYYTRIAGSLAGLALLVYLNSVQSRINLFIHLKFFINVQASCLLAHRSLRKSKRYFSKTNWLQCILKDDEWAFVKLVYGQKKWLSWWWESNPQPSDVKRAVYYIPYVMEYDSYSMIFVVFHFLRLDPTANVVFYEYCQCFVALYIPLQDPLSILLLLPTRERKSGCMHVYVDVDIGDPSFPSQHLKGSKWTTNFFFQQYMSKYMYIRLIINKHFQNPRVAKSRISINVWENGKITPLYAIASK